MNLNVKFEESKKDFPVVFGETYRVSDGGYERGYEAGYNAGFAAGNDTSVEDSVVSRTINDYFNDRVTIIGQAAFYFCAELRSVIFTNAIEVNNYAFRYCSKLKKADFHRATSLKVSVFEYCYSLTTLILRSETVCNLANVSAFNNCYHILGTVNASYNPEGLKDGYIYVPDNLVEQYKAATNWSTFASQIKPLSELNE